MAATDYQTLIDAATWEFIRQTEAAYPPDTASLSIADQRAIYDAMCRIFHRGYPPDVTVQDGPIAGVPCRTYQFGDAESGAPARPHVLYLHGGGFVVGGLESHDDVCAEICAATGLGVVAVEYRLCPEHPHPAAYDDCLAVARATPGPILLVGDSAGGNLAAALAANLRGTARVLGQVLIYPGLGGPRTRGSYITHAHAPMLTADDVAFYAGIRHGGREPSSHDPTANPLQEADFSDLPPTLAIAAECDPLADDVSAYVTALKKAGCRAHARIEPGLVHGYLRARKTVPRAATSFACITRTISAFATGQWPFGDSP
jgi:acetyl esterase